MRISRPNVTDIQDEGVNWVHPAQDSDQRHVFVRTVLDIQITMRRECLHEKFQR